MKALFVFLCIFLARFQANLLAQSNRPLSKEAVLAMELNRKIAIDRAERARDPEGWDLKQLKGKAADGNVNAQYLLACKYHEGKGIPKDLVQAVFWFEKAASQGDAWAQFMMGNFYSTGEGVKMDQTKSADWYSKASAQGNKYAQYILGLDYLMGSGVPKSERAAAELFSRAAASGHDGAQYYLARMYASGTGVAKDAAKANFWYYKAAAQGNGDAQIYIGWLYFGGKGVQKDFVRCYAWWNLAAAHGDQKFGKIRDALKEMLTPEQKTKAEQLSLELFAKETKGAGLVQAGQQKGRITGIDPGISFSPQIVPEAQQAAAAAEFNKDLMKLEQSVKASHSLPTLMQHLGELKTADPYYESQVNGMHAIYPDATSSKEGEKMLEDASKLGAKEREKIYGPLKAVLGDNLDAFTDRDPQGRFLGFRMKDAQDAMDRVAIERAIRATKHD